MNRLDEMLRTPICRLYIRRCIVVLGILILSACNIFAPLHIFKPSPYLSLLRENGFSLPDDTTFENLGRVSLQGNTYEIIEYHTPDAKGLQIVGNDDLLQDPEIAFNVLLAHAWSPNYHKVTASELASLKDLQNRLSNARQNYSQFFELGASLQPVIEQVDRLQNHHISGIPLIQIGPLPLIDITNAWDLICTIPLDVFDLCILEPLVREVYEQSIEIETLLSAATFDLNTMTGLLEAQKPGEAQNGLELKTSAEKTISSLDNLIWKLDRFETSLLQLQIVNQIAIDVLENQRWGQSLGKVISFLQSQIPGFDMTVLTQGLTNSLKALDSKLSAYLAQAQRLKGDLSIHLDLLLAARLRTDAALDELGQQWRFRP